MLCVVLYATVVFTHRGECLVQSLFCYALKHWDVHGGCNREDMTNMISLLSKWKLSVNISIQAVEATVGNNTVCACISWVFAELMDFRENYRRYTRCPSVFSTKESISEWGFVEIWDSRQMSGKRLKFYRVLTHHPSFLSNPLVNELIHPFK